MAKIAMPLASGYEDSEFQVPYDRLREAGHEVVVIGRRAGQSLRGKKGESTTTTDAAPQDVRPEGFDALVIPGGHSPDELRLDAGVVEFVREFGRTGRPIAAICHGPQLLIEADLVRGVTLTSWPSVRKDLENAGATWVDREVVEDGRFISSRKPQDLDAFTSAVEKRLAETTTARR